MESDGRDARERVHRLEIAMREMRDRLDTLEGSHDSLSHSVRGRLGGRGRKASHAPERLEDVPYGDKRGLRALLLKHRPEAKEQ